MPSLAPLVPYGQTEEIRGSDEASSAPAILCPTSTRGRGLASSSSVGGGDILTAAIPAPMFARVACWLAVGLDLTCPATALE